KQPVFNRRAPCNGHRPALHGAEFYVFCQLLGLPIHSLPGYNAFAGDWGRHIMARIETQDRDLSALSSAEKELAPGEQLVWADRPRPAALARRASASFLFGIPFTAFSIFWVVGAYTATQRSGHPGPEAFFPLFGLIFVGAGLFMMLSPLRAMAKARSTIYAIT